MKTGTFEKKKVWVNHQKKVVSFHYVEEFKAILFETEEEYFAWLSTLGIKGYKCQ